MTCPTTDELNAHFDEPRPDIAAHTEGCVSCRAAMETFSAARDVIRAYGLAPSPDISARIRRRRNFRLLPLAAAAAILAALALWWAVRMPAPADPAIRAYAERPSPESARRAAERLTALRSRPETLNRAIRLVPADDRARNDLRLLATKSQNPRLLTRVLDRLAKK